MAHDNGEHRSANLAGHSAGIVPLAGFYPHWRHCISYMPVLHWWIRLRALWLLTGVFIR